MTRLNSPSETFLQPAEAARKLRQGDVIVLPTETVYGLAANALDATAVQQIFRLKGRPASNPLIVHFASLEKVEEYLGPLPAKLRCLALAAWPGPLTIVLESQNRFPKEVTAGLPTVAVRVPAHPVALQILSFAQLPLAAPSANRSGTLSPTVVQHAMDSFGDHVAGYVDGGACDIGLESTVVRSMQDGTLEVLRWGGFGAQELERLGYQWIDRTRPSEGKPESPGQSFKHYAPKKPIQWATRWGWNKSAALVCLKASPLDRLRYGEVVELSQNSDISDAGRNLFATLHRLDKKNTCSKILVRPFPEVEMGRAIQDRLRRAIEAKTGG